MNTISTGNIPVLATADDCAKLASYLQNEQNIIALLVTSLPRSNVKIMTRFRHLLQKKGWRCLLFARKNAYHEILPYASDYTYIFDDTRLLKYCNFISALFTHDYCKTQIIIPPEFTGRLYFFPHHSGVIPLRHYLDAQADGIIATRLDYGTDFKLSDLPNSLKRYMGRDLLIIPAGYPKFDILFELYKQNKSKDKMLVYYPQIITTQMADKPFGGTELIKFLKLFFATYPDWHFVIRPYKKDRTNVFLNTLSQEFKDNNFTIDLGEDNDLYLMRATFFMTDTSSTHQLFSYTTLRPSLFFLPISASAHIPNKRHCDEVTEVKYGYQASNAESLLAALRQAELTAPIWEKKLLHDRELELFQPGHTLEYLCDHMPSLLNGTKESNWIALPKGNTPSATVRDWLLFFARFSSQALFQNYQPPFLAQARLVCKEDPRLSLAALRMFLRLSKNGLSIFKLSDSTADLYKVILMKNFSEAMNTTPSSWAIKLLRHLKDTTPCAIPCLALLQHRSSSQGSLEEVSSLLRSVDVSSLDIPFMNIMLYLMIQYGMLSEARVLFKEILPQAHLALPLLRPAIGIYLLYKQNIKQFQQVLLKWNHDPILTSKTGLPLLQHWISLLKAKQPLPSFFYPQTKKHLTITLYGVPIFFEGIASARRALEPAFSHLLAEARADKSLWTQTLAAARLCRMGDAVALCAWEMFKAQCLSPKIMEELEAEGFGPKLAGLQQILGRFVKTHRRSPTGCH